MQLEAGFSTLRPISKQNPTSPHLWLPYPRRVAGARACYAKDALSIDAQRNRSPLPSAVRIAEADLTIQEKLDLGKASLHWLRHTCGTRALERNVPLEVVQRQLGHADPRTTMRYARPQLERLQTEMEKGFG